jgi:hypothetical protein
MRHTLDKFTKYVDLPGKDLCAHAYGPTGNNPDDASIPFLQSAVDSINPEHDIKVFIANNRTGNPVIQREEFQSAPDLLVVGKTVKLESLNALKNALVKRKLSADEDEGGMFFGGKKPSRVERALKAAWGNPPDEFDEEVEREREMAI